MSNLHSQNEQNEPSGAVTTMQYHVPVLVYRLQLNRDFTFREAEKCLPYLKKIGVSHVYLSPILKAVAGSNHCYDVTDFSMVNPELGGEDAFNDFCRRCSALALGIILDVVPNHMAYSPENPYVEAAFVDGTAEFRRIYDTFKNPFSPGDQVIFPFLPESPISLMEDHRVSVTPGIIPVLNMDSFHIPFLGIPEMPGYPMQGKDKGMEAAEDNGSKPSLEIHSTDALQSILEVLPLRPVSWLYSSKRINYRRFFAVNGLIAIRSQDMDVIRLTHVKILELARREPVAGVRIDHLDGLYDPAGYIRFLREELPGKIIVAEKVLVPGEALQESLKLDGTTGYDFLGMANALYADPEGYRALRDKFIAAAPEYGDLKSILRNYMGEFIREEFSGDLDNISWPVYDSAVLKHGYEYSYSEVRNAVEYILASFVKYRTYSTVGNTAEMAGHLSEIFRITRDPVHQMLSDHVAAGCEHCTNPVLRIQQFSGALMAKNIEDRLFFSFNPLIFMNEVGWNPMASLPAWSDFLGFIHKRKGLLFTFNESSTHDSKYGEDLRCAGLVISEYPELFSRIIADLLTRGDTARLAGRIAIEHLFYITQLILASHGFSEYYTDYRKEIAEQITKAMRESMVSTAWKDPNDEYERNALSFADTILNLLDSGKWSAGTEMAEKCQHLGFYNSFSMLVLRFMLPGAPSMYQGSEHLNVHFTDPDNREKVNFGRLQRAFAGDVPVHLKSVDFSNFPELKTAAVALLAKIRLEFSTIIENCLPAALDAAGPHRSSVLSYYMNGDKGTIIVAALRHLSHITGDATALRPEMLESDIIIVPQMLWGRYTDLLSGQTVIISGETRLSQIMGNLPAAVLRSVL